MNLYRVNLGNGDFKHYAAPCMSAILKVCIPVPVGIEQVGNDKDFVILGPQEKKEPRWKTIEDLRKDFKEVSKTEDGKKEIRMWILDAETKGEIDGETRDKVLKAIE